MNSFLSKISYKQILAFSALLTFIIFLVLRNLDIPLNTSAAPNGIVSFEMAKYIEESQSILSSWDANAKLSAGLSLGIDFLFLIAYSVFFATACFLVAQRFVTYQLIYKIGVILSKLQFVAALFDAIENTALIKLLLGSRNEIYSIAAYYFASAKFIIIILGVLYIFLGLILSIFHTKTISHV